MRSLLGRFHRPMSRGAMGDMLTMNSLGDGSTLSLDFTTMGGVLDPRLTFSRASTATFVNSSGYVEYAGANTAPYSELLSTGLGYSDNAILSRSTTTSPTGNTAVVFYPTLVLDYHRLQFSSPIAMAGETTISVYVKQIGSDYRAGINAVTYIGASVICSLVGAGSVVGAVGGTAPNRAATITKVTDDGWYRITLTGTYNTISSVYVFMASSTSTDSTGLNFIGVAAQGISIWGFQINPGSTAQTYYPTTTAAYYAPRFDYSPTTIGEPRGLLIEGSATNLSTRSEDFAHAEWTKDNSGGLAPVVTTVSATTPANGSTVNQIVFNKTGGVFSRVSRTSVGTTSSAYTMSVWMRTVSGTANVGLRIGADPAGFNCAVTTTWKRFEYTYTLSSTDSSAQIMLWDNIVGNDETANVYVWGCQVEAGSGASSYIPTGANGVTRNMDICYSAGSNFSSWFSDGRGTVVAVSDNIKPNTQHLIGNFSDSTNNNYIRMGDNVGGGTNELLLTSVGGVVQGVPDSGYNPPLNTQYKIAYAWEANNFACVANGGTVALDNTGSVAGTGVITSISIGIDFYQTSGPNDIYSKNGHIKSFKYFPTRLSNAQLQTLTAS